MADIRRTSEYRKLLPFIARASGDVGSDTVGEDVQALLLALNAHKTSDDHDGRYYTETESDVYFALKADKTITLTAGEGLTGGGNLSANRTFDVNPGAGIAILDDKVIVDQTENFNWTGEHTFTKYLSTASIYPNVSDTYDLGDYNRLWRKIWGSELSAIVFAQYTQVLLGGWFTVSKGEGIIQEAVNDTQTTINLGTNNFATNDIIVFRGLGAGNNPQIEYMKVGTLVSGTTYNVIRDLDGTGANAWPEGSVYGNWGQTGNGRVELNAYDTPRMSVYSQGMSYNDATEEIRIGDLYGQWGYSAATYGAAFGSYETGKANITIDPTNGVRLRNYSTTLLQLNGSTAVFGTVASGKPNVLIDANGLYIRNNTTEIIKLTGSVASFENVIKLGTYARLEQGTGTWGSSFTGTAMWNDSGVMNIGGWNNNVKQWWGGSNGDFYASSGNLKIDSAGITFKNSQDGLLFYSGNMAIGSLTSNINVDEDFEIILSTGTPASNFIRNGDFSTDDLSSWAIQPTITTSEYHSSPACGNAPVFAPSLTLMETLMRVSENEDYTLSFWQKVVVITGYVGVNLVIEELDENKTWIRNSASGGNLHFWNSGSSNWTEYSFTIATGEDTNYLRFKWVSQEYVSGGYKEYYIDDISFTVYEPDKNTKIILGMDDINYHANTGDYYTNPGIHIFHGDTNIKDNLVVDGTIKDGSGIAYLKSTGKAADSDKLDGLDSTAFAAAGHDHDGTYIPLTNFAGSSPTVTASSGTFTTVSCFARTITIGKMRIYSGLVYITDAGTASGTLRVPIPSGTAASIGGGSWAGTGYSSANKTCTCILYPTNSYLELLHYDGITAIASGVSVSFSITYEIS